MKLIKDCSLIDKKLASPDVDLAFTKIKAHCCPKGERKIGYEEFIMALGLLAEKRGMSHEDLV